MVTDTILLVGRAERDGGNNSARFWVWLRANMDCPSPESIMRALQHSIGCMNAMRCAVDRYRGHRGSNKKLVAAKIWKRRGWASGAPIG